MQQSVPVEVDNPLKSGPPATASSGRSTIFSMAGPTPQLPMMEDPMQQGATNAMMPKVLVENEVAGPTLAPPTPSVASWSISEFQQLELRHKQLEVLEQLLRFGAPASQDSPAQPAARGADSALQFAGADVSPGTMGPADAPTAGVTEHSAQARPKEFCDLLLRGCVTSGLRPRRLDSRDGRGDGHPQGHGVIRLVAEKSTG